MFVFMCVYKPMICFIKLCILRVCYGVKNVMANKFHEVQVRVALQTLGCNINRIFIRGYKLLKRNNNRKSINFDSKVNLSQNGCDKTDS